MPSCRQAEGFISSVIQQAQGQIIRVQFEKPFQDNIREVRQEHWVGGLQVALDDFICKIIGACQWAVCP